MASKNGDVTTEAEGPHPSVHWTRSLISITGVALTKASAVVVVSLLAIGLLGLRNSPYLGILGYLVLPALLVLGLLLIPVGLWRQRRRLRAALEHGEAPRTLPIVDLNRPRTRQAFMAERFGVEGRGAFYEEAGAIRDVVQNHMLQVLTHVAMEPSVAHDAESVPAGGRHRHRGADQTAGGGARGRGGGAPREP